MKTKLKQISFILAIALIWGLIGAYYHIDLLYTAFGGFLIGILGGSAATIIFREE